MLKPILCPCLSALLAAIVVFCLSADAPAQTQNSAIASIVVSPRTASGISQPVTDAIQLGDSLVSQRRYEEAIDAYSQASQKTAAVWNRLGIAYQLMSNTSQAERCYKQSLKLDPRNSLALNNLGTIAASFHEYDAAERLARKALQIDPQFATGYKNLGTILIAEHKLKQGQEAYAKAMALNPDVFFTRNKPRIDNAAPAHDRGAMNYSIAAACARAGQTGCALEYLRTSMNEGFADSKSVAADTQFAALSNDPGFRKLLAEESGR